MNLTLLNTLIAGSLSALKPPSKLNVYEWAEEFRYLSPEASSTPGKYRTADTPYQQEIMESFNDPAVEHIVFMSSSQIGKTELLNNIVGYIIDRDPSPTLVLQPTLDMAGTWSKDRLAPMLRDTPVLKGKVFDGKSSGTTIFHKSFPGGHLTAVGSNSPASLASRPIRFLLEDEVDRYAQAAGNEGDARKLAGRRLATFDNRKRFTVSTPGLKELSHIEPEYLNTDQRRYFVPCPDCGHYQVLKWSNCKMMDKDPDTAYMECEACLFHIQDKHKPVMLREGQWRATATAKNKKIRGYHLNALYSPWTSFSQVCTEFLECKDSPEKLQTFVNTMLGETFSIQKEDKPSEQVLMDRRENYEMMTVPLGGLMLTAGVDTQDDRLAVVIRAWGKEEESWLIFTGELYGNPASNEVWQELDQLLFRTYTREDGKELKISGTFIDSGGHYTNEVYDYARQRYKQNVRAIKGSNDINKEIVSKPSKVDVTIKGKTHKNSVELFNLGVGKAKSTIHARLVLTGYGKGRIHWYSDTPASYFEQLLSENQIIKVKNGYPYRVWHLDKGKRNEALDCEVYAYACAILLGLQRHNAFKNYVPQAKKTEEAVEPVDVPASEGSTESVAPEKPKNDYIKELYARRRASKRQTFDE
jgi:phage terminase large subunit GpA-like protein